MIHQTSKMICDILRTEYIDFSKPENFIKLMDLLLTIHKYFNLQIKKKVFNFTDDTLNVFLSELEECRIEKPLYIKNFLATFKIDIGANNV